MSLPAYDPQYAWFVANSQCPAPRPEDGPTHYGEHAPKCGSPDAIVMHPVWALVDCPDCRRAADS